jgi:hypothetical protein
MRTFAQRPQAARAPDLLPGRRRNDQPAWRHLQSVPGAAVRLGAAHAIARVPVLAGRTTLAEEAQEEPEQGLYPVSQSRDVGPGDAGAPTPPGPAPKPAPLPTPTPAAPPPPCTLTTRTLVSAPDGTANTRTEVGVNEQVEVTASSAATWTATGGTVSPASGAKVTWTAPGAGASCTVTATPAKGSPCSVAMTAIPPSSRSLVWKTDKAYSAGKAGSGYFADVTIVPTRVSFSRTELREDTVNSVASGYYKDVLRWDGITHPATTWLRPNASNSGLVDEIGSPVPGTPGPFSAGRFEWPIPQMHRPPGSTGNGSQYSTGRHIQVMAGPTGAETTSKEGSSRSRTP